MSLEIHDISKSFEDNHVLSNINFSVKDGEFVSLLGPSGSGKSTLFSIIGGMRPAIGRFDLFR